MEILKKLQRQPESVRKLIVRLVAIILGLVMLFFWVKIFSRRIEKLEKENLGGKFKLPAIEFPQIATNELNLLEEAARGATSGAFINEATSANNEE